MFEDIEKDTQKHHHMAFTRIHYLMEDGNKNISEKLEIIKAVRVPEVREMLYEHYISILSKDLFYEKSKNL